VRHLPDPRAILAARREESAAPVAHCTWAAREAGVVRLHLVPPRPGWRRAPSLLHVNGQHIIPLAHGPAALLRAFMGELNAVAEPGREVSPEQMQGILERTAAAMHRLYPAEPASRFLDDIGDLQDMIRRLVAGEDVPELAGQAMTLAEYAPRLRAPLRMDLAVMPMRVNGEWACPLACGICYAAKGAAMMTAREDMLDTAQWREVLDRLWRIGVPQVSFTGGDPLARADIAELVAHARQFITRLNTSAVLLTPAVAAALREADLDVMQVTVYSHDPAVHDPLVGRPGALGRTLDGIRAATDAGIEVSVNTPLVPENLAGYADTVAALHGSHGIRYFTASGMLPAGAALKRIAAGGAAPQDALYEALRDARSRAASLGCELDFTSPGCLSDERLASLGLGAPACGAALGNMAIAPDGEVLPCQSWVHEKRPLGNILKVPWKDIWNHPECRRIRAEASLRNDCPLRVEAVS
jgi:MoaA/NifB/PqqE/SkfB family radical SAM enzyme